MQSHSSTETAKPKGTQKNKFTREEDQLIIQAVEKYGSLEWVKIAEFVPNRTARQCRERWKNYLAPHVQTGNWSSEEDEKLKKLMSDLGPQWAKIAKHFPNRTDVCLKNHWVGIQRKEKRILKKSLKSQGLQVSSSSNESSASPISSPIQPQIIAQDYVSHSFPEELVPEWTPTWDIEPQFFDDLSTDPWIFEDVIM